MTASAETSTAPAPSTRWTLDPSHSSASFSVRHMMITNVRGELRKIAGGAWYDPRRPEATKVWGSAEVASIDTREEKRDAHLRSADFFDAERYPTITFESKAARRSGDRPEIIGDLTIRGTTREVVLTVEDLTAEHTDPWGNVRVGAHAWTKIRRSDFGMTWNAALEAGGVLVGDEVKITLDVSLVRGGD